MYSYRGVTDFKQLIYFDVIAYEYCIVKFNAESFIIILLDHLIAYIARLIFISFRILHKTIPTSNWMKITQKLLICLSERSKTHHVHNTFFL